MANREQRRNKEKKKPKADKNGKKVEKATPSFLSAAQKPKESPRPPQEAKK